MNAISLQPAIAQLEEPTMSIDRIVLMFAGTMILVSLALSQLHSPHWLWLTTFVGFNLLQSAFTGFCPSPSSSDDLGSVQTAVAKAQFKDEDW